VGHELRGTEPSSGRDGFFYDLLHFPNGDGMRPKVRSMVGLRPLCASTVLESRSAFGRTFTDTVPNPAMTIAFAERRVMSQYASDE
jgi:hypothetical protein